MSTEALTKAQEPRYRGGRISLTAREADLLLTVGSTCGDYAPDSVEFTTISMSREEASQTWDRIMDKLRLIAPRAALATKENSNGQ